MRKRWFAIGLVICLLAAGVLISILLSKYALQVSHYEYTSAKLTEEVHIVQLTDLHNAEFGTENQRLVEKVEQLNPDLILFTGDILNMYEEDTQTAVTLIEQLVETAPVYFSLGNHELGYDTIFDAQVEQVLTAAGAKVLQYAWEDVAVRGQKVRIGGVSGYVYPETGIYVGSNNEQMKTFLEEFQDTDALKIMLSHYPVSWLGCDTLAYWDFDLVLCGHVHGGQIRLPFVGGVYAPDQGFFPGRVAGEYLYADGARRMILSRGLGSTEKIPRMNNLPEIIDIFMMPE